MVAGSAMKKMREKLLGYRLQASMLTSVIAIIIVSRIHLYLLRRSAYAGEHGYLVGVALSLGAFGIVVVLRLMWRVLVERKSI